MRDKDARKLVDELLAACPDAVRRVVAEAQETLARDAREHAADLERIERELEAKRRAAVAAFEARRSATVQEAVEVLTDMQLSMFEEGDVEAALATRTQISLLQLDPVAVEAQPDPGTLSDHETVGETHHFEVVGSTDGSVWGSGPYTSDSTLAAAAVHAGAVKVGERGVVTVEVVSLAGQPIRGSRKNGVSSADWSSYEVGYLVRA